MAGLLYTSGFQVGGTNAMKCTAAGTALSITSGFYLHGDYNTSALVYNYPLVQSWTGQGYSAFAAELATKLTAAVGAPVAATFDITTGLYTLSSAATFSISFGGGSTAINLRNALGFSGNKAGAISYLSDFVPYYSIFSAIGGRTGVHGRMEPADMAEETVSDGGVDYVITRKTTEKLMAWSQNMEPFTAIDPFAKAAAPESGWTWQDFWAHTRGTHPFICVDVLEGEDYGSIYRLTAKGASFRPVRVTADFNDHWSVPFETRWLGMIVF